MPEETVELPEDDVVPEKAPKRGDTIEHVIRIDTTALQITLAHDEEAEQAFRNSHAPRELKDVTRVQRQHVVGQYIDYVFTGTLK